MEGLEKGKEDGFVKGKEDGFVKGKEDGLVKGKEAIARNLLAKGWAVEEVAETTELPLEKVRSLVGMNG
jgi:predicted transposase YdaD